MDDGPRFGDVEGGTIYDIYAPDDEYPDPEKEESKIASLNQHPDHIIDGREVMHSVLTQTLGNNQGAGDNESGKIYEDRKRDDKT